ncbi:Na+/H+ antiporter subunit E [Nocardiopsis exhalans]|uniref:Multicomponent Na+:H+ antiporter subunit E n=2 Tax=Nocardiopsis TaxID=2013 RepID=A0A840WFT4_9ACTN|nr:MULTISPECIES: Na+/H+ antiporter subunit E [Nocardiopsis]MBB5494283.1 multicomponent Na+:H+ antiporter subunit E [Nocardiopsis metallicus]USY20604.1 Na+/H+ antiporter subunit E [Nocardiopsis exhalans]
MTPRTFLAWILGMLWLPCYVLYDLLHGSVRVSRDILLPGDTIVPAFVEVPLRCRNDLEISLMANLISLSPGSLTVAARHDPATLWVHAMYAKDHRSVLHQVHTLEDTVLRATRPEGVPPRPEDLERDEKGERR